MFIDARELSHEIAIEADICIIGAGAAGITLARELIGTRLRVAVLEAGGLEFEPADQDFYAGGMVGLRNEAMDVSRLRFFGGTTNHWAGWCRPLDEADFEPRPGPGGWPFRRSELLPFYERAQKICELGPFAYDDPAFWTRQIGQSPLALDPRRLRTGMFQVSPPTRFGQAYQEELRQAGNVVVYLNAAVLELQTPPGAAAVTAARARGAGARDLRFRARYFVLATGGLENARLLLLSNATQPAGLGNAHDAVGRYLMDHPWFAHAAIARFATPDPALSLFFGETPLLDTSVFAALMPGIPELRDHATGNFRVVMQPVRRLVDGVDSLKAVGGAIRSFSAPAELWEHLGNILHDYDAVADSLYRTATGSKTSPFPVPVPAHGPVLGASLDINVEQMPNPESRVTLSGARDANGQRRLDMDWRLGEAERRTYTRAQELVALEFGRLGLGRINAKPLPKDGWPADLAGSRHHMGTTRMSEEPRSGVVDANGRVHGVANLYIAGSSVFPTCGAANPTLTIVALALRLGDRLRQNLA